MTKFSAIDRTIWWSANLTQIFHTSSAFPSLQKLGIGSTT